MKAKISIDRNLDGKLQGTVTINLGHGLVVIVGSPDNGRGQFKDLDTMRRALAEAGWRAGHALLTAFEDGSQVRKALRTARP